MQGVYHMYFCFICVNGYVLYDTLMSEDFYGTFWNLINVLCFSVNCDHCCLR